MGYNQIDMDPNDIEKLPLVPKRALGVQEVALWAKNGTCHISTNDEHCVEWSN